MNTNKQRWTDFSFKADFKSFVEKCRDFDPIGFDRAITQDEKSNSYDFHRVVVEGYQLDTDKQSQAKT
jgi:hypothetical protein